jgi:glycolate dehydrogenase FAD-binding subunit
MVADASMRQGSAADAVDGVVPGQIVEPADASELAATLHTASRDRQITVLRGGGTKLGWGRTPASVDLIVSTAKLNTLLVHRHGDLTATAHAGVTLAHLNRELARHGQWLPVDSAFESSTVGGIIATNDAGPLRHRHGTPRDLLIGVTLALTDGRLVKAGGTVVKNVAGYDLGKLVTGSFGTLGAIVDATFKLLPMPKASATLDATYDDGEALARDVMQISSSQLEPMAFDVRLEAGQYRLLARFSSSPAAVQAQIESAQRLLSSPSTVVTGDLEQVIWEDQVRSPWNGTGTVIRFGWLPAKLAEITTLMRDVQKIAGPVLMVGRAGVGAGLLRVEGDVRAHVAVVERLRTSTWVGNVSLLRADLELKTHIDVWGPPSSAVDAARALKQMFDPSGILNAGRGPI